MAQQQDPTRVRRDDVALIGPSETKVSRTSEEKQRDLTILADLWYRNPNQNHYELTERFNEITGRTLTRSRITKDLNEIRRAAAEGMVQDMQIIAAEERAKLDAMEKNYYKLFYDAQDNVKKRIIDSIVRENEDGDMEEIVKSIRVIEEFSGEFSLKVLNAISDIQKERRKLLGVYAYSAIEREREVDVELKGYMTVSPDDWEEEGEDNE